MRDGRPRPALCDELFRSKILLYFFFLARYIGPTMKVITGSLANRTVASPAFWWIDKKRICGELFVVVAVIVVKDRWLCDIIVGTRWIDEHTWKGFVNNAAQNWRHFERSLRKRGLCGWILFAEHTAQKKLTISEVFLYQIRLVFSSSLLSFLFKVSASLRPRDICFVLGNIKYVLAFEKCIFFFILFSFIPPIQYNRIIYNPFRWVLAS